MPFCNGIIGAFYNIYPFLGENFLNDWLPCAEI
jgi:hypothetical protein